MDFEFSEDRRQINDSVERLFERSYDFEARRRIMTSEEGHDPKFWRTLSELGLVSLPIPANYGGMDGGAVDMIGTMEAFGNALCLEPYLSTILGARILIHCGDDSPGADLLQAIATGEVKLALAYQEDECWDALQKVECRATGNASGWSLTGSKIVVQHAPIVDRLLVTARLDSGEFGIFITPRETPGLSMETYRTVDGSIAAHVDFANVSLTGDSLLLRGEFALEALEEALDFATVLVCCEALGVIRYANGATLEFLKNRKQFGVPIGSFQVLQHRMVDMVIAEEQARSLIYLACAKVDAAASGSIGAIDRRRAVSACKINVSTSCRLIANESVQLHGGMGLTDEMKISHAYRRLWAISQQFGSVEYHLERFGREEGETLTEA